MLLNADLGESWYARTVGDDAGLMPYLDTCNLACGFHGGDALTQLRTARLALHHGVAIGAHPSFPDRRHFGRRAVDLPDEQLFALLLYQTGGLQAVVHAAGGTLTHLKPHGALYHYADAHPAAAASVARVAAELGIPAVYGPPGGELARASAAAGLDFLPEGFADRRYAPTLHLRPRHLPDASLSAPEAAAEQVRQLLAGHVVASDGKTYPVHVRTVCLHGDHAGAVARARAVRTVLDGR